MRPRALALLLAAGCAPAASPLSGAAAPSVSLPRAELPPGHRRIVFNWEFQENESIARGEGVVRVAPPDSARLDLFLAGGFGSGAAILIDDRLYAPIPEGRRMIPPPTLLWAALGRLSVPPAADTSVRVDGSVIRADIGRDPVWRVEFAGPRLNRLDRIIEGRVTDFVVRGTDELRYEGFSPRRKLTLRITRDESSPPFDAAIWSL